MAATRLQFFERELKVATADLEPRAIAAKLAQVAREAVAEAIEAGEASAAYSRFVNGVEGASEDSVTADGAILYLFQYLSEVAEAARDLAISLSPSDSGAYKRSWFYLVDGAEADSVPDEAQSFVLVNDQPYARKIDVGHMHMSVPPGIVERVRQQINSRYGNQVKAQRQLIPLAGGYVLKGHFRRGVRKGARKGLRADTRAGQAMSYPALLVTLR